MATTLTKGTLALRPSAYAVDLFLFAPDRKGLAKLEREYEAGQEYRVRGRGVD